MLILILLVGIVDVIVDVVCVIIVSVVNNLVIFFWFVVTVDIFDVVIHAFNLNMYCSY